ncbi:hypothetical protein RFI_00251 [Reticulomyxa filosa]|uniref:SGT1 protein n=1 Tax=Reticulomyxa filosa TaxID=46433 RepID=X6PGJ3_RETFI|nr:hypothetical protein RFI_00251 [Reticulomyxa filosa]|eukprot:ETO36807.1 hypothetical protein RFI_00251 [Reticulomyxa filosa]
MNIQQIPGGDDDFVCLKIYFRSFLDVSAHDSAERLQAFDKLGESVIQFASTLCANYLWQRDAFHLVRHYKTEKKIKNEATQNQKKRNAISYWGHTRLYTGNNIEDEWFMIYLLFALSQQFQEQVIISVEDNDGEVLLIECAYKLPKWLSSVDATRKNYAFVYKNEVHIVSLQAAQSQSQSKLDTDKTLEALNMLFSNSKELNKDPNRHAVDKNIQQIIQGKLNQFSRDPKRLQQNNANVDCKGDSNEHYALCVLPLSLKYYLQRYCGLLPFVGEFLIKYHLEIDKWVGQQYDPTKRLSLQHIEEDELVFCSLRMTHYCYAMIDSHKLFAHKNKLFINRGFDFQEYVKREYNNNNKKKNISTKDLNSWSKKVLTNNGIDLNQIKIAFEFGVKIAVTMEYILSQGKPFVNPSAGLGQNTCSCDAISNVANTQADVDRIFDTNFNLKWKKYLNNLKRIGYFSDLLEHSKAYDAKLDEAKQYYLKNIHNSFGKEVDNKSEKTTSQRTSTKDSKIKMIESKMIFFEKDYYDQFTCYTDKDNTNKENSEWINKCIYCAKKLFATNEKVNSMKDAIFVYDNSMTKEQEEKKGETDLSQIQLRNDDISWLHINEKDLDQMMNDQYLPRDIKQQELLYQEFLEGDKQGEDESDTPDEEKQNFKVPQDWQNFSQSVHSFLKTTSGLEGVEVRDKGNSASEINIDGDQILNILNTQYDEDTSSFSQNQTSEEQMRYLMETMDLELNQKYLKHKDGKQKDHSDEQNSSEEITREPLDIDIHLVQNILDSHLASTDTGGMGPARHLLTQLGWKLNTPQTNSK